MRTKRPKFIRMHAIAWKIAFMGQVPWINFKMKLSTTTFLAYCKRRAHEQIIFYILRNERGYFTQAISLIQTVVVREVIGFWCSLMRIIQFLAYSLTVKLLVQQFISKNIRFLENYEAMNSVDNMYTVGSYFTYFHWINWRSVNIRGFSKQMRAYR